MVVVFYEKSKKGEGKNGSGSDFSARSLTVDVANGEPLKPRPRVAALIVIGCFTKHRVTGSCSFMGLILWIGRPPSLRPILSRSSCPERGSFLPWNTSHRVCHVVQQKPDCSRTMPHDRYASRRLGLIHRSIFLPLPVLPPLRHRCLRVFANWNFRPCSAKQLTVAWSTSQTFFISYSFFRYSKVRVQLLFFLLVDFKRESMMRYIEGICNFMRFLTGHEVAHLLLNYVVRFLMNYTTSTFGYQRYCWSLEHSIFAYTTTHESIPMINIEKFYWNITCIIRNFSKCH